MAFRLDILIHVVILHILINSSLLSSSPSSAVLFWVSLSHHQKQKCIVIF